MNIQSLSIVVPAGCTNNCRYCVSKLHNEDSKSYSNQIEKNFQFKHLYKRDYVDALSFARDNGCNTMMLTGDGEAILNRSFVEMVSDLNQQLSTPFRWIELQTSGVHLTQKAENGGEQYLRWLRDDIRVKVISLSLSSIWSSDQNAEYNRPAKNAYINIEDTCKAIKKYDFTLRLSLNMTDFYNDKSPEEIFMKAKELGADQLTFRVLYNVDNPQDEKEKEINDWINLHRCNPEKITEINNYIKQHGRPLERLPFGAIRYSVHGMSCVLDDDCMNSKSQDLKDEVKYLILRPDCKLYTKWDDKGSCLF